MEILSFEHGVTELPKLPGGYAVTYFQNRDGSLGARARGESLPELCIPDLSRPAWEPARTVFYA